MRPCWGWWPLVSGAPGHYHLMSPSVGPSSCHGTCHSLAGHSSTEHSSLKMSHRPGRTGHSTVYSAGRDTVHSTPGAALHLLSTEVSDAATRAGPVFTMKQPGLLTLILESWDEELVYRAIILFNWFCHPFLKVKTAIIRDIILFITLHSRYLISISLWKNNPSFCNSIRTSTSHFEPSVNNNDRCKNLKNERLTDGL